MLKRELPVYISFLILLGFTFYYIFSGNYEFLVYVISIALLIILIAKTDKIFKYPIIAMWGFLIWFVMHMLGGSLYLNGVRLYDTILFPLLGEPYNIFRYDQFLHIFCYIVLTLFIYSLVIKISDKKANKLVIGLIVFLAGLGLGAINEIIEFSTVALFDAQGVGGYFNNALDLVFNAIGCLIALLIGNRIIKK
jgi:uncharacterized membrane protein YjdF